MAEFQYTTVPGKIGPFLEKVRTAGVPAKATVEWIKALGFKSSNDRSLLAVLKAAGFVDSNGVPTESWRQYRGGNHRVVLAKGVRAGYAALFEMYSDAWRRKEADLQHFFSTRSKAGEQAISKTIGTFKALVALADFAHEADYEPEADESEQNVAPARGRDRSGAGTPPPLKPPSSAGPALHIDVQIHISSDAKAEQIDQIFASMAKHLYGRD